MTPEERKQYNKEWYKNNKDKAKKYYLENRDRLKEYGAKRYHRLAEGDPKFLANRNESSKKWLAEHPDARRKYTGKYKLEKQKQYAAARNLRGAVQKGNVIKPTSCERCGERKQPRQIHGHHEDYSKPRVVVWLCYWCHKKVHKRGRF